MYKYKIINIKLHLLGKSNFYSFVVLILKLDKWKPLLKLLYF